MVNSNFSLDDLKKEIDNSQMILIGIGSDFNIDNSVSKDEMISVYNKLYESIKDKNYFIVTLLTDDYIYDSIIPSDRIVAPCGSQNRYQCSNACCTELWDKKIDKCPYCGSDICENVVSAENYVEEGYLDNWKKYTTWLMGTPNHKLLLIELDVMLDYPGVIRFAFEKTAFFNDKARFIRINHTIPQLTPELKNKGVSIEKSGVIFLRDL